MITEVLVATTASLTGGFGLVTGIVAIVAATHQDKKVRADAAKVLDRLLRRARR